MKNEINSIMPYLAFDGTNYEAYLCNPIKLPNGYDIVRVITIPETNECLVHCLDENDETEFISFDSLDDSLKTEIIKQIQV